MSRKQEVRQAFDILDKQRDGMISASELKYFMR